MKNIYEAKDFRKHLIPWIIGGIVACGVTHLATAPLDMYKVLANVGDSEELKNIPRDSILSFLTYCLNENFFLMFRGWVFVLLGYGQQGIFKFGLYTPVKFWVLSRLDNPGFWKRLTIFILITPWVEATADIALSVFELAKVKVQKNLTLSSAEALRDVWATGFSEKWAQYITIVKRQVVMTTIKFPIYEILLMPVGYLLNRAIGLRKQSSLVVFLSAFIAGATGAIPAHFWDRKIGLTEKEAGQLPFLTGLGSSVLRMGLISAAQWLIFTSVSERLVKPRRVVVV